MTKLRSHGKLADSKLAGSAQSFEFNFDITLTYEYFSLPSFGSSISSEKVDAGGTSWKVVFFPKGFTVSIN